MTTRLTRADFTTALQDKRIDVTEAKADPKLAGLDVAKADLDHDGKISGAAEAAALFKEVDRYDRNGDAGSIDATNASGAQTTAGAYAAAATARAVFDVVDPGALSLKDAALKKALSAAGAVPVKRGASGDPAVAVQYALARLGVDVGVVDGKFGPGTERAVKAFQTSAGLPASGVVDAATVSALDAKLSSTDLRVPAARAADPLAYLQQAALDLPKLAPLSGPATWNNPDVQKKYGEFVAAYWPTLKDNRFESDCKTLSLFMMDAFRVKVQADLGVKLPKPAGLPDVPWDVGTAASPHGYFSRFEKLRTVRPGYENAQAIQRLDPQASMIAGVNARYPNVDANMASRAVKVTAPWDLTHDNHGDQTIPEVPVQSMKPGDVIFIDHTGDGRVDHMANVVSVNRDAAGQVTSMVLATGSYDDMKDANGATAPNGLGEVNNYAEEVTVTFGADGKVTGSKVTWSSEPSWLVEGRYSARTLLMELRPGGRISVGRWAQPA